MINDGGSEDDNQVDDHDEFAQRKSVDVQGKQVCCKLGASGSAAAHQDQCQPQAGKTSAKDDGDQRLPLVLWQVGDHHVNHCGGDDGGDDRFDDNLVAHFDISPDQQRDIHQYVGCTDGDAEHMVEDGCNTGQSTGCNLVGSGKGIDGNREQKTARQKEHGVHQKAFYFFLRSQGTCLLIKKILLIPVYPKKQKNSNKIPIQKMPRQTQSRQKRKENRIF